MLRSLYGKLSAVLLLLFCLVGVLYIALTLTTTRMYQQEINQKLNRTLASNLVRDQLLTSQGEVNPYALTDLFHLLMIVNPSIEMYLLDVDGKILAFSAAADRVKRSSINLEPVRQFLQESSRWPILGDDPRDHSRSKVFSAAPIPLQGKPTGYLYIVLGGEDYDSAAAMLEGSYIVRLSLWAGVIGLLFALVTGLVLFNLITRRLRELSSTMDTFARSNFAVPVPVLCRTPSDGRDEIDRLESSFDRMGRQILRQLAELKQTDTLRRELVANVSHDLRTPLAALHGYLETLLIKEGRLSDTEQRNFLQVALRQSGRLRRLVEDLFELAKLDANADHIRPEQVALPELLQDVSHKFQLSAEAKGILVKTELQKDIPFVEADISLIERAMENLLQNALHYTPEGGTVTITLAHDARRVTVSVQDTGCGIPPEHLPHVFDRFYRVDRERQGNGAGLGLAITKRIIDLHGGSIEATSTPNKGTCITWHLPTSCP